MDLVDELHEHEQVGQNKESHPSCANGQDDAVCGRGKQDVNLSKRDEIKHAANGNRIKESMHWAAAACK